MKLNFKGPFDLNELICEPNAKKPGVYIFGFKEIITADPNVVVHYYVGITAKDSILKTITDRHIKKIDTHDSTYLRLTEVYMHEFYKSSNINFPIFPINKPGQNKNTDLNWKGWTNIDFQKYLYYYNNAPFLVTKGCTPIIQLFTKKTNVPKNEFPIDNIYRLNENKNNDALLNRINNDNFWIWYAEVDLNSKDYSEFALNNEKKNDTKTFEIFEAFVKYSLKGITIGKSEYNFTGLKKFKNQIQISKNQNIFKNAISDVFLGDYSSSFIPSYKKSNFIDKLLGKFKIQHKWQITENDSVYLRPKVILSKEQPPKLQYIEDERRNDIDDEPFDIELLGSYCFKSEEIHLYVLNIEKAAKIFVKDNAGYELKNTIEILSTIVLLHEISHWLIMSVLDSENNKFNEIKYETKENIFFHEGLAQYFTWSTIELIGAVNKYNEIFEWLLNRQSERYTTFEQIKRFNFEDLVLIITEFRKHSDLQDWSILLKIMTDYDSDICNNLTEFINKDKRGLISGNRFGF